MPEVAPNAGKPAVARVRVPPQMLESLVAASPYMRGLDKTFLARLLPHVEAVECGPGAVLVAAGAPFEGIGLIVSGSATILAGEGAHAAPMETLAPPLAFGEAGHFAQSQPYAVVANEPVRALWIKPEAAAALLAASPALAETAARRLATVLAKTRDSAPVMEILQPLEEPAEGAIFDPTPLASLASDKRGQRVSVPFVELDEYDLQASVLNLLPVKVIKQHRLLPLKLADQHLVIGMVAPRNGMALAELKRLLPSVNVDVVAISADDYMSALAKLKLDDSPRPAKGKGPGTNPDALVFESAATEERDQGNVRTTGDEAIKLVNRIVAAGLDRESSDIHVEPTATGMRVRYRVDGVLQDWPEQIPASLAKSVVARVKVLAGLDITERRLPQDGRIGFTVGKRDVDLRVSTLPANRGEKIVMRILEAAGSTRTLDQIFLEPTSLAAVRRTLQRPFGGIIVAGATGSGKTSSMYALLHERKATRPDTNIITVEDPIEYRLSGVTQVQVNPGAGLQFPVVLRAMLRQDPDVIVVGETRDAETARMSLEAAMTGHLLLTSLHANNAMSVFQRLENLGCSRPLIAQSVALVLVQRLVRKLCPACVTMDQPPKALLESLVQRRVIEQGTSMMVPRAVGCDACKGSGYQGRAVVVEALAVTDDIRSALSAGKSLTDIERIALATNVMMPFHSYSAFLMGQKLVSGSEALLTVAE